MAAACTVDRSTGEVLTGHPGSIMRPDSERGFEVFPRRRWVLVAEYLGRERLRHDLTARWFRNRQTGEWFTSESWKRPSSVRLRPEQVYYVVGLLTDAQRGEADAHGDRPAAATELSKRLIRSARAMGEPCGGSQTWLDLRDELKIGDEEAKAITSEAAAELDG